MTATGLAAQTVRAIRSMDGSQFVCLMSPDDSTEGEDQNFDLIYRMLGFCEVQKENGNGHLRFIIEVNEPERVADELRKIIERVAEKALAAVGTSNVCETITTVKTGTECESIADKIAESVVRDVCTTNGPSNSYAVGLFAEEEVRKMGDLVAVSGEVQMAGAGWFYNRNATDPLCFLAEVNDPEPIKAGLRKVIAQAVRAGIEEYRMGGRNENQSHDLSKMRA